MKKIVTIIIATLTLGVVSCKKEKFWDCTTTEVISNIETGVIHSTDVEVEEDKLMTEEGKDNYVNYRTWTKDNLIYNNEPHMEVSSCDCVLK